MKPLTPLLLAALVFIVTVCVGAERRPEPLNRGLLAVPAGSNALHVSWRFLDSDPPATAFVLEHWTPDTPGTPQRLTAAPLRATTSFLHEPASASESHSYRLIVMDAAGKPLTEQPAEVHLPANSKSYRSIRLQGDYGVQKVALADLNGDGALDFVVKQPDANVDPYVHYWKRSTEPFTLEAYDSSGRFLWEHNLGWSIERGVWYSPYVVFDLDGDGRAEVAVKTGEGDPRDPDGKVTTGPEHLTVLNGLNGHLITRTDWPSRDLFADQRDPYNYASRNQLAIAFLDGHTPSLIVERGTYNVIVVVAYDLVNGALKERWRWDNRTESKNYWGQGAHSLHAADVDADGRDELIIGSAVIDDDGTSLWTTSLGHPDHAYVGDLDPAHDGLEIYYGIESRQKERNGMCMVDARTGRILWGYEGPTRHVHSQGLCSDIDARHPGAESYSADTNEEKKPAWARLWTATGQVLSAELEWSFGPTAVYWDADPQREVLSKGRLSSHDSGEPHEPRIEGKVVAVADIAGDWREEILTSVNGELRIYSTPIPAAERRPCLMQDPLYRNEVAVASMGYFQVPLLSYDMASR